MPKYTFSPIEYYSKLNFLSQLEISFTAIKRPSVLSISILTCHEEEKCTRRDPLWFLRLD